MDFKKLWQDLRHPAQMFGLYLAATTADFLSSLNVPKGFMEQNPFARHVDGSFWPAHALIHGSINIVEFILVALGLYYGLKLLDEKWAKVAAGVPFLYYGYEHLDAAFSNILIRWPGLYVHIPYSILDFLR